MDGKVDGGGEEEESAASKRVLDDNNKGPLTVTHIAACDLCERVGVGGPAIIGSDRPI